MQTTYQPIPNKGTVPDYFAPNDIVYNTWGYDQTNIDFYRVTKVTAKFVTLEAIGSTVTEYHTCGGEDVIPDPTTILTSQYQTEQNWRHGIRIHDNATFVNFRFGGGYKWDGKPKHVSYGR